jgi:hypothetical protein
MGRRMSGVRLGGEDAAWWQMEAATNPMVVTAMLELGAPLPDPLVEALFERLGSVPELRSRIVRRRRHLGPPARELVAGFDPRKHVERVKLESSSEGALRAYVGAIASRPLDPSAPLWRMYLVDRPGKGTTVVFRVHHCMADGFALIGLLSSLADPTAGRKRALPRPIFGVFPLRRGSAKALAHLLALPKEKKLLLKGRLGTEKRVGFTPPLPLAELEDAAHATSSTVNDLIMSIVAGGLRRYLERHGPSNPGLELHAMVPVDLRHGRRPTRLDNRIGLVVVGLPIGISDPLARLGAVKQRMRLIKATPEANVAHAILRVLGWTPRPAFDAVARYFGAKASLVLTNVRGPTKRVVVGGIPIRRIVFWVPPAAGLGLGISAASYAGQVTMGVFADACILPDPEALAGDLQAELAALYTALRAETAEREERIDRALSRLAEPAP